MKDKGTMSELLEKLIEKEINKHEK